MSEDDALKGDDLKMTIFKDMLELATRNKFNSLEKPKQLYLMKELFSVENDLLTPTFKLKRNIARDKFRAEIDEMYAATPLKA